MGVELVELLTDRCHVARAAYVVAVARRDELPAEFELAREEFSRALCELNDYILHRKRPEKLHVAASA